MFSLELSLATTIITDGTQEHVIDAPRVVLPAGKGVFDERSARFSKLAAGHAMADYLRLMATLTAAQASALGCRAAPSLSETARTASRDYGMPPLAAQSHARDSSWRADLHEIARQVGERATTTVRSTLDRLLAASEAELEGLADRVLHGTLMDEDAAVAPFVGAALQVYFTRCAADLDARDVEFFDVATVCPVCAMRPVASIVRIGGAQANLRYLVCTLCATEWNMVRIKCTSCEEDKSLNYLMLDAGDGRLNDAVVRAEACGECKGYLKVIYQERDPQSDPTADDLATLALDLLVDERGYSRTGPNLLFYPGSG